MAQINLAYLAQKRAALQAQFDHAQNLMQAANGGLQVLDMIERDLLVREPAAPPPEPQQPDDRDAQADAANPNPADGPGQPQDATATQTDSPHENR